MSDFHGEFREWRTRTSCGVTTSGGIGVTTPLCERVVSFSFSPSTCWFSCCLQLVLFSHFDLQIKEQRGTGGGGDGQRWGASWSQNITFPNKQGRKGKKKKINEKWKAKIKAE